MKSSIFTSIFFVCFCTLLNAQQSVTVDLINNSVYKANTLVDISEVIYGHVTNQYVLLKELGSNETGYADFEVNALDNSEVLFSFEEQAGDTYSFHLTNGSFSIDNTSVTNQSFTNNDLFRIERCSSGVVLYHNNNIAHVFENADQSKMIYARLYVVQANLVGSSQPVVNFSFPNGITNCSDPEGVNNFIGGNGGNNGQVLSCDVSPPFTDDMFYDDNPCSPTQGIIFTYEEFQSLSDNHNSVLGYDYDSLSILDTNKTQESNTIDFLAGTYGDMTLEDIYDCLDIGCSPMLDTLQHNLDTLAYLLGESLDAEQISDLNAVYADSMTAAQQVTFDSTFGSMTNLTNSIQELSSVISEVNVDSLIADAFGATESDCNDSIWDDIEIPDSIANSPVIQRLGGGDAFKKQLKESVMESLKAMLSGDPGDGGDPNWFLGEVEGLGLASTSSSMPSPSSTSMIKSIQSGVNLYNGTGSFQLPLESISSKDVSVPISISSSPGALKVNDQEGLLGSNMNLSHAGKITRVVKGLPDEFYGEIDGLAYGYKRGLTDVMEIYDVHIQLDTNIKPKWLKRIICRIVNIILKKLFNIDGGGLGSCSNNGFIGDLLAEYNDDLCVANPAYSETIAQILGNSAFAENLLKKYYILSPKDEDAVKISIYWRPVEYNYITTDVIVSIPLGVAGLSLNFGLVVRAGYKIIDVPSPVTVKKNAIGYSHLT
ncbi:MAG: hypothetical protein AAF573_20460, partial [Bacteroidota bacterium]